MANNPKELELGIPVASTTYSVQKPTGEGIYLIVVDDDHGGIRSIGVTGDGDEAVWLRVWANVVSTAIQHGVPFGELLRTSSGHRIGSSWFTEAGRLDGTLDAVCKILAKHMGRSR